jgi:hypothetical protein
VSLNQYPLSGSGGFEVDAHIGEFQIVRSMHLFGIQDRRPVYGRPKHPIGYRLLSLPDQRLLLRIDGSAGREVPGRYGRPSSWSKDAGALASPWDCRCEERNFVQSP